MVYELRKVGTSTREPPKSKAELRLILAEAVRNTQPTGPERLPTSKKVAAKSTSVD